MYRVGPLGAGLADAAGLAGPAGLALTSGAVVAADVLSAGVVQFAGVRAVQAAIETAHTASRTVVERKRLSGATRSSCQEVSATSRGAESAAESVPGSVTRDRLPPVEGASVTQPDEPDRWSAGYGPPGGGLAAEPVARPSVGRASPYAAPILNRTQTPVSVPQHQAPSGLFPRGRQRPMFREPFPIGAGRVACGILGGTAWMGLFGLMGGSVRGYAWWTIAAAVLASGVLAILTRFGDRGVAVGAAVACAVGLSIASFVVALRWLGGDWVLW